MPMWNSGLNLQNGEILDEQGNVTVESARIWHLEQSDHPNMTERDIIVAGAVAGNGKFRIERINIARNPLAYHVLVRVKGTEPVGLVFLGRDITRLQEM